MSNEDMFMNFYDPSKNSKIPVIYGALASIIFTNKDQFYNVLYNAICNHPQYVMLSDLGYDKKIKIIDGMIEYFKEKEYYENCAKLVGLKKELDKQINI